MSSAIISPCGAYRYSLSRPLQDILGGKPPAVFLMLNPSTADASLDDPTIRRCRSFARSWACNGFLVVNLYALRSPDPSALWQHSDPVGPDNDRHILEALADSPDVVCAWGTNAKAGRVTAVRAMLSGAGARLWCLGSTKDGSPRHPLYVAGTQPLVPWIGAAP